MLTISATDLRNRKACANQVELFVKTFGEGDIPVTKRNAVKAAKAGLDINWAISELLTTDARDVARAGSQKQNSAFYKAEGAAYDKLYASDEYKAAQFVLDNAYKAAEAKRRDAATLHSRERDAAVALAEARYNAAVIPLYREEEAAQMAATVVYDKTPTLVKHHAELKKLRVTRNVAQAKAFANVATKHGNKALKTVTAPASFPNGAMVYRVDPQGRVSISGF